MYKYKNVSGQNQIVPGIGYVKAGEEIDSNSPIENANFELVSETNNKSVVGTEAPQPNAVVQGQQITPTTGVEIK